MFLLLFITKVLFIINFLFIILFLCVNANTTISLSFPNDLNQYSDTNENETFIEPIYFDYIGEEKETSRPPDIYPDPNTLNEHMQKKVLKNDYDMNKEMEKLILVPTISVDGDLKGHDFIDNIMYIYYGTNDGLRRGIGSSIIVIGCVIGLAAQALTLSLLFLRSRRIRRHNAFFPIATNFLGMVFLSNLTFILGVQTSPNSSTLRCKITAILLHFLHLSTAVWSFIIIYTIYDYIKNDRGPKLHSKYCIAYIIPAVYVMFSYTISHDSYEIRDYCWMSVHRGMIFNYMIPISTLIIFTTITGTLCLRLIKQKQRQNISDSIESILDFTAKCEHLNTTMILTEKITTADDVSKCCSYDDSKINTDIYDSKFDLGTLSIADLSLQSSSENHDFADLKRSVRFTIFFQPVFAICWFLGVIALENSESNVMPIIFIICYNIMSWSLFMRSSYICPQINPSNVTSVMRSEMPNSVDYLNTNEDTNNKSVGTDTIPLLCSATTPNAVTNAEDNKSICTPVKHQTLTWDGHIDNPNGDYISTIST